LEPETETLEKPYASLRRVSVSRLEDGKRFVSAYILFRPGSAKLTSAEQAKLEEFARSAKKMKIALVIAEGYSNRDETSSNNIRALASDRAHLVKEFLVSFGLDRDRIYEEGSGIPERIPQVDTLMNAQRGGFVELSAEQAPVPAN
jgi:outer membrane protein OmpA-like peptidoglycan-associated protein